jgi:hypothetical protein
VRNPFADRLTFPDERTRLRRDHEKYLTLIDTIALLHQYQRKRKTAHRDGQTIDYIEVTLADIAIANRLAHEALGRCLDELSPQARRLLDLVSQMVAVQCTAQALSRTDVRFSRRDVREYSGWSDFQVKIHMKKLEDLEYVLVHRGRRGQTFVYELLYDGAGRDGKPFLMGLVDVQALEETLECRLEGQNADLEHPTGSQRGTPEPPRGKTLEPPGASTSATSTEIPHQSSQARGFEGSQPQFPSSPAAGGL